ncbi:FkbM family methyltransferase [Stappia sp.]|uniref:FkbM family methyltransferase n=1 Tax=Stappia sp. TaxID=1870903 RepID=UPI003A98D406
MRLRSLDPPFGAHALSAPREALRRLAGAMPENRLGRIGVSLIRKLATGGAPGPFDVEVFPSIRARLYPTSNRCEKRAVAGAQLFDPDERAALRDVFAASASSPFVFVDLGANVGLYSLWMVSTARAMSREVVALAVEPDAGTRARLEANLAASGIDCVMVADCAVGEHAGRGAILAHEGNRGEHTVRAAGEGDADSFEVLPIHEICARRGIARIDAMKVDLEGHDEAALRGLFANGPRELRPGFIVVEAGKEKALPGVVRICLDNGYELARRTRLNALLRRVEPQDADTAGRRDGTA